MEGGNGTLPGAESRQFIAAIPFLYTSGVFKPPNSLFPVHSFRSILELSKSLLRFAHKKEGGLLVDYIGIAGALKQTMNDSHGRIKKTTVRWILPKPPCRDSARN
jgi:hypothetical protein